MNAKLYRNSKIGESLKETLWDLIEAGKLTEDVAEKVMTQFDASTHKALETKVATKATLRGNLKTYRSTVIPPDTQRQQLAALGSGGEVEMDSAKLVCIDSKLIQQEQEERDAEREQQQLQAAANHVVVKTEPGVVPQCKKEKRDL